MGGGRGEGKDGEEFIGIVLATWALDMVGVAVAVIQETKTTDPVFASRSFRGYLFDIGGDDGQRQEGGSGATGQGEQLFTAENEKATGPKVISFELLTRRRRDEWWYIVGCYLLPSDKEGETHRRTKAALDAQPARTWLLLLGDLNADLDCPRTRHEEILAADFEEHGLRCVTEHSVARRRRQCKGRWTWR